MSSIVDEPNDVAVAPVALKRRRIQTTAFACLWAGCAFAGASITELAAHFELRHRTDDTDDACKWEGCGGRHCARHLGLPPKSERVRGLRYITKDGVRVHNGKQLCLCCAQCTTTPIFGIDRGRPTHCHKHAVDGMLNVVSKRCTADGCETIPIYGTAKGKPTHCATHAAEDMLNLMSKRCAVDGCETISNFGTVRHKPTHCSKHAVGGMCNVMYKRCAVDGCTTRPTYGTAKGKPTHCRKHVIDGSMVNVIDKRCAADGCETIPTYGTAKGTAKGKPTHCAKHATTDTMCNVVSKRCSQIDVHGADVVVFAKFKDPATNEPLCTFCHHCTFPDEGRTKIRQEEWLIEGLRQRLPELEPFLSTRDCVIRGGCSLKRPDALYLFESFAFELECDEHGHRHEDCLTRLTTLQLDHGYQASLVLRINPNSKDRKMLRQYKASDGSGYYAPTRHFDSLMDEVEAFIRTCVVTAMKAGGVPAPCLATAGGLAVVKLFF